MRSRHALLFALAVAACDGGEGKASAAAASEADPAAQFAVERARARLVEIEGELAKGGVPSFTACAGTKGYVESLRGQPSPSETVTTLVADVDRVCDHEVPKAVAKAAIAKAQKARAAQPDKKVLSECHSADYNGALETLKAAKDDEVAALEQQFSTACPKA
jgi:hypothetical protein